MTDTRHDDVHDHDDERLVQLLGRALEQRREPSDPTQARLLDWLARDARAAGDAPGVRAATRRRQEARAAARFAKAVLARQALARGVARAAVTSLGRPPAHRAPAAAGSVAATLAAAESARCAPLVELRVAAGAGRALWEQECERWVELPPELPRGAYVALGVSGDSMVPLLADGDTVLVRVGEALRPGSVIVARRGGDGYVVKQLARATARTLELHSLNAAYAPVRVARRPGTVLGTVVARWRTVSDRERG